MKRVLCLLFSIVLCGTLAMGTALARDPKALVDPMITGVEIVDYGDEGGFLLTMELPPEAFSFYGAHAGSGVVEIEVSVNEGNGWRFLPPFDLYDAEFSGGPYTLLFETGGRSPYSEFRIRLIYSHIAENGERQYEIMPWSEPFSGIYNEDPEFFEEGDGEWNQYGEGEWPGMPGLDIVRDGDAVVVSCREAIGDDMPEFDFLLEARAGKEEASHFPGMYGIERLTVTNAKTRELIGEYTPPSQCARADFGFRLADINFDGYLDMMFIDWVWTYEDMRPDIRFNGYIWNTETETFEFSDGFTFITNAVLDYQNAVILSLVSTSPASERYSIYEYNDGAYQIDAELLVTSKPDGRGGTVMSYEETYFGEIINVLSAPLEPGELYPAEAEMYYETDSFWKLFDPLWYANDYLAEAGYQGGGGETLCSGYWHASPGVGSGFNEQYAFFDSGIFVHGASEMDGLERELYSSGGWFIKDSRLYLEAWEKVVLEGGEEVPADGSIATDMMITGGELVYVRLQTPDIKSYIIGDGGIDAQTGKRILLIDGEKFYDFNYQSSLMDSFQEALDMAGAWE